LEANITENEMSATNSLKESSDKSKESSDESQESSGKNTKCAVSSNRHDLDSTTIGGKREAAGGGMVAEENHQVNASATMQKEESSATKMKARLNHSNIINRERKQVSEDSTCLSKQEKASKSKRKKERCQAEDEMAKKDAKQNEKKKRKKVRKASDSHLAVPAGIDVSDLIHDEANMDDGTDMHITNANDINANANDANAQLSINQSALTMSETQISQVVAENQILAQSCAQARIVINDVMSPVQVATGEEKVAADLTNDITETEALATMESHSLHAHASQVHPHAHAHHQVHSPHTDGQHHHAHHASTTPSIAGLSARLEETWESRFRDLAAYKEQHGNCLVPRHDDGLLGSWVSTQRTLFTSRKLKADRYEKLVRIGFAFEDARFAIDNKKWNKIFMELVEYKEKNGHCNCPSKNNGSLGRWVKTQRNLFRSKKLKEDRYEKLVGIGFVFEDASLASENAKWNRRCMELEKYKQKNRHCNFPTRKDGSLGSWVSTQRTLFRSKKLKADRYEKLVGIGVVFEDARFAIGNVKWNRRFMELVEYKEKNGHCNCPVKNNGSLGKWVSNQRTLFRSMKLKEDRHEKLLGIGFA
jgi:DNA-binding SARP family transcriptional activator